jgi:two-component system, chemotaxis family, sensor kinase CheA
VSARSSSETPATADPEFLRLFATEAEERLAHLSCDLLALEAGGDNADLVASMFREAHNLKGAAAVVGLPDLASLAHAVEDALDGLRRGERQPDGTFSDAVLAAIDAFGAMLPEAIEGVDVSERATEVARTLSERSTPDAPAEPPTAPAGDPRPTAGRRGRADESLRVPLSRLDELSRLAGEAETARLRVGTLVRESMHDDPETIDGFRDLGRSLAALQDETLLARMVPLSSIAGSLQRAVRDVARTGGKRVRWEVRGEETELDRRVLERLVDPLLHLVRNAVDHGIEPPEERERAGKQAEGHVALHAMQLGSDIVVTVTDDGAGIDLARVRDEAAKTDPGARSLSDEDATALVFRPGLTTTMRASEVSGRGVGLDVVRTELDAVRGRVEVRSVAGAGTEFRIAVPITLSVVPSLVVIAEGQRFAIPMRSVVATVGRGDPRATVGGRPHVWHGERVVPETRLATVLGLAVDDGGPRPSVILTGLTSRHAFAVDGFDGQRDVVLKGLGRLMPRLDVVAGAGIEPDGTILLVLDAGGLIDRGRTHGTPVHADLDERPPAGNRAAILVVDDALTVRELQRSILERAGYDVRTAVDGAEAMARLAEEPVDLVLTDIEMPNLDGFGLVEAIRAHESLSTIPVVLLTTRSDDASRRRGLDAGADGYIVKADFDGASLVAAVERLLGVRG